MFDLLDDLKTSLIADVSKEIEKAVLPNNGPTEVPDSNSLEVRGGVAITSWVSDIIEGIFK